MKLDEAIDQCIDENGNAKYSVNHEAFKAVLEAAKNWQTLVDARKDATAGEWAYLDWKEQKERGVEPNAYESTLEAFYAGENLIMDFGISEQYYPTEGQEPSYADAAFIVLAANLTEKDTER